MWIAENRKMANTMQALAAKGAVKTIAPNVATVPALAV